MYSDFIHMKQAGNSSCGGFDVDMAEYGLYPHQADLARWAARRGRAAIFADTGLGKSRMQIAWADTISKNTDGDVIILAPLAVAEQTVKEGAEIGVTISHALDESHVRRGITIVNYERIHKFDMSRFVGVVLDESSVIKNHSSKTLQLLLDVFRNTQYKLCATATPAPNDWTEIGTHAEFLGVRSQSEMLAEYFVHDGGETQKWRLKGHARHEFWKWVSTWGAMVRSPKDLGHDDSAYILPELTVHEHVVEVDHDISHGLFAMEAQTLMERRDARKKSVNDRVSECAAIVNSVDDHFVVWCDLNAEGDALTKSIKGAVQISGSDDIETKEKRLRDFAAGKIRVLVSKPSICGFGLNWQHCNNMAFVGVTDSFEAYYQAVRRCWRFGQKRPVDVHIFSSNLEGAVVKNLKRKEKEAKEMADMLAIETRDSVIENVIGRKKESNAYITNCTMQLPSFLVSA